MFLKKITTFIKKHPLISGVAAAALGITCKEYLNNLPLSWFFLLSGLKISSEYMYNGARKFYGQIKNHSENTAPITHITITQNQLIFVPPPTVLPQPVPHFHKKHHNVQ